MDDAKGQAAQAASGQTVTPGTGHEHHRQIATLK
jgi:hypothetical protein